MRDRILLLSAGMPPKPVGSAVIVGNLAKQFGRDELIIVGERPFGQMELVWRADWPQLIYATDGWPPGLRGARWWRKLQVPRLLLRCVRLVKKHQCTAVLVVFPCEEFLFAGYLVAVLTRAKLFPYFHNTYVENRTGLGLRFARWLQSRVFSKASCVFVMSEGMAELYRERYPQLKCAVLPHSFNDAPVCTPPPKLRSPLRFVICGNINESCRDATVRVCAAITQVNDASLTLLSGTASGFLRRLGVLREGVRHLTVPQDQVVLRLQDGDIVVLAHGFEGGLSPEEYRTIFPTRTIEYLICGRPILAHVPPDSFLAKFLKEHECALLVAEPSVNSLLQAIEQLRADPMLRNRLVHNALCAAAAFRASRVAALLRRQVALSTSPELDSQTVTTEPQL